MKIEVPTYASGYPLQGVELIRGEVYSVAGWEAEDLADSIVMRVEDAPSGKNRIRVVYMDNGAVFAPGPHERFRVVKARLVVEE